MYETYRRANARYAVQFKSTGEVIEKMETKEDVDKYMSYLRETKQDHLFEVVDTKGLSCVSVSYTEMGGPWGYGHQEESFRTYGSLVRCLINLEKFIQEYTRSFGPDPRDVYDYFRHCSLTVNGKSRTEWFHKKYTHKINMKTLYI